MSRTKLQLESLGPRIVPSISTGVYSGTVVRLSTRMAVLDFGRSGVVNAVTANEMLEGNWLPANAQDLSVTSFRDLFTSDLPFLDINGDGVVTASGVTPTGLKSDADLAIDAVVAKVRADYAPYDLDIVVGSQKDYQGILTDAARGDVIVLVNGPASSAETPFAGAAGASQHTDRGNQLDDLSFVFGRVPAENFDSADLVINAVARHISHEMGHDFGLSHIFLHDDPFHPFTEAEKDGFTHHTMFQSGTDAAFASITADFDRDFGFQDVAYEVFATSSLDKATIYTPGLNAYFNSDIQNAHQILSHPEILGPSPHSWMAVLRPGELTVSGTDAANTIAASDETFVLRGSPAPRWAVTIDGATNRVPLNSVNVYSANPFDAALGTIRVFGLAGDDSISTASGNDLIYGGEGNDTVFGGLGNDSLYGAIGNDRLDGGDGDDNLYGQSGNDVLYGRAGDDRLDAGGDHSGAGDVCWGGLGHDTFIRFLMSAPPAAPEWDEVVGDLLGDTVIVVPQ